MITGKTFEEHWDDYKNMAFKLYLSYNVDSSHRDDLIQAARIGLHRAIQTYKEDAGSTFITWVFTYMKKEQIDYINQNIRTVRIPVSQLRIKDREPEPTEYMDSLDTSIYDDGEPLYSTIQYEDDIEEINPFILQLRHYLPQVKERYQTILKLRYMEEKTFEEVAEQLGVSRENVRQLHDKAINQLQLLMGAEQKINKRQRIKPQLRTKKSTL